MCFLARELFWMRHATLQIRHPQRLTAIEPKGCDRASASGGAAGRARYGLIELLWRHRREWQVCNAIQS